MTQVFCSAITSHKPKTDAPTFTWLVTLIGDQIAILHQINTLLVQINDDQEDLQKDLEFVLDSSVSETSPQEAAVQDTSKSPKPSSSSSSPAEHKESRSHSTGPPPKPDRSQQVLRSLRHLFKLCYSNLHIS